MKIRRIAPALPVLILLLTSCGKFQDPEFRKLDSFKVKKADLEKTDIGFIVTCFNPNRYGVAVKEAEAEVYVDSVYIGKFVQDKEIDVDRKAEFSIPLTGSIPLMKLLKLNLKDYANREVLVKADGTVKIGKAGVFMSRPFTYRGKHQVDIHL
jgi:LEA14-like dessication related protein